MNLVNHLFREGFKAKKKVRNVRKEITNVELLMVFFDIFGLKDVYQQHHLKGKIM